MTKTSKYPFDEERARLVRICNQAFNVLPINPARACEYFTQLLEDVHTKRVLLKQEIANMFYNRSLTYRDLANDYLNKGEYQKAQGMMRLALSDSHNAEIKYANATDKAACFARQAEYESIRQAIIKARKISEGGVPLDTDEEEANSDTECMTVCS